MSGSFFPFTKGLAENEIFKRISPAHRLYFFLLISEFNLRGKFYKSDLEAAVTISTSLDTIRRARKEFQRLEWAKARPGFLEKGKRPVATTYFDVAFSQVEKGEFFSPIHRYAFEALLYYMRRGTMGHKELLTFFYVCYLSTKYREDEDFFISKRELCELTGLPESPAAVLKLNEVKFFGDESLFVIEDVYHKIKILKHWGFVDPEDSENNRMQAVKYREDISRRVSVAKTQAVKKPRKKKAVM
ncbi:hypothetical protein [Candidatus Contubernalis alkaliaceticus]|uniref:hypothetical protein n=1 Tax=Candidatus Contubernalis alkaliaceticus TaxID=338645 RepID=UPI001F4BE7FD|nr:hypothetical protein [Candidatus Contubernalis alkalaceticus]UNC92417.1 hypothetical protein HUE98_10080 [Candidatus Contubernalis alkalaceticus]